MSSASPPPDSPAGRFRRAAAGFTAVAESLGEQDWDRPSPCEGWVARDIVTHLATWVPAVLSGSGLELPAPTGEDPLADWQAFDAAVEAALADPAVAATRFDAGPPGEMTVEQAVSMLVVGDVLVHTWDLARAAGMEVRLDDALVAEMLTGLAPIADVLVDSGHYEPAVELPADADPQARLLALTGRRP